MIFTILDKNDLAPLMEIDDFISVVWNNKYYTAGEFEIIFQTTPERIEKVARDNYITLNGSEDIAIIELITFSDNEEQGAIMTVKGSFAQSILNRRIFWENTKLNGDIGIELRKAIENNAINPTLVDRSLNKKINIKSHLGKGTIIKSLVEIRQIQILGQTYIVNTGTINNYGVREGLEIDYTYVPINHGSEHIFFKDSTGKDYSYFRNNPLDPENVSTIFYTPDSCYLATKSRWHNVDVYDKAQGYKTVDAGNYSVLSFYIKLEDLNDKEIEDQAPFSTDFPALTKEQYDAGGYGVTLYDNTLYFRFGYSKDIDAFVSNELGYIADGMTHDEYVGYLLTGQWNYGTGRCILTPSSCIIYSLPKYVKETLTPNPAIDFKKYVALSTKLVAGAYGQIYIEWIESIEEANIFALGNEVKNLHNSNEADVYGENLLNKTEELLELFGAGLKARYSKNDTKIYFDFYKGANRSNNIVFAESLDNLNSYTVNLANGGANVALVYSKDGETEYRGTAGAVAGVERREIFVNETDKPGYIGADYATVLAEEGKLFLQGVKITIESEIDANSYVYRDQYSVGDIVKLVIKDLGIEYIIRVLEVREYQDENGYSIDLILGE